MLPVLFALLAVSIADSVPVDKPIAVMDVSVIDATGRPVQTHRTVTILKGKIVSIEPYGPARVSPEGQVIDGRGKYLMPGLWDMHVHWYDERYLPLFIANGVTGVRQMWGMPEHQQWRRRIKNGSLLGPRLSIASPIVDGPKPVWPGSLSVDDAVQARAAVAQSRRDGADFIKVYSLLPRDAYFAIADESKKEKIPFAGHVPVAVRLSEASDAGQKSVEHLDGFLLEASSHEEQIRKQSRDAVSSDDPIGKTEGLRHPSKEVRDTFDPQKAAAIYRLLARNHTWQTPTLVVLRAMSHLDNSSFTNDPRLKYMPESIRELWIPQNDFRLKQRTAADWAEGRKTYELNLRIVGGMHRAGVPLLAGTDTANPFCFPGFSIHDELALLVSAGLTPMEAIQAATRNAAQYTGIIDSYGTVEKGKKADLVLLDADPLHDIQNTRRIAGVMVGGRFFDRTSLDKMLTDVEALAGRKSIVEPLLKTINENGVDAGIEQYRRLRTEQPTAYNFDEDELNALGYRLLRAKKAPEAIRVFQLVVAAYPRSSNAYDSLAEAYAVKGDKDLAITNYRHSLELNPRNASGAMKLKTLEQK